MTVVLALTWAATAAAGEDRNVYLAQARVFYQGLEFEKCLSRLEQAGRVADGSKEELAQIELYTGLCRFNLGRRDEAETNFKLALQLDPSVSLPPETSPRITEVFDRIASTVRKALPPQKVAKAPPPSPEPGTPAGATGSRSADAPRAVSLQPSSPSQARPELVAAAPSPLAGKALPLALGGASVLAAGAGAVLGVLANGHAAQANDPHTFYGDAQSLGSRAQGEATTANVLFGLAGATAVAAVVTWVASE